MFLWLSNETILAVEPESEPVRTTSFCKSASADGFVTNILNVESLATLAFSSKS